MDQDILNEMNISNPEWDISENETDAPVNNTKV